MTFFAKRVAGRPDWVPDLPRVRRQQSLPAVRSKQDVLKLINAVDNPKHRALLMVMYSSGLRVGERVARVCAWRKADDLVVPRAASRPSPEHPTVDVSRRALSQIRSPLDVDD